MLGWRDQVAVCRHSTESLTHVAVRRSFNYSQSGSKTIISMLKYQAAKVRVSSGRRVIRPLPVTSAVTLHGIR